MPRKKHADARPAPVPGRGAARPDPLRAIKAYLAARESELLGFTRDLIAIPSATPPGDERAVAQRIQHEFDRLQLGQAEILALQPERPNLLLKTRESAGG